MQEIRILLPLSGIQPLINRTLRSVLRFDGDLQKLRPACPRVQFIIPVIEMKILKLALDDLRTLFANKPPEITPTLHINIVKHIFVGRIRVYNILCCNLAEPIAKFYKWDTLN